MTISDLVKLLEIAASDAETDEEIKHHLTAFMLHPPHPQRLAEAVRAVKLLRQMAEQTRTAVPR